MTTEPTDAELQQLWQNSNPTNFEAISFARAVLAKWGTPAPVGVEPALHQYQARDGTWKDFDSERHRRDTVAAGYPVRTLYTVTQPQAGAVPLSIAEEERMLAQWDYEMHGDRARYIEAAHGIGIKGGQHGTDN